jgi:hypothetical protein
MNRAVQIIFALALLLSQYAAQMHSMSHLQRELAVAQHGERNAPPLGHSIEKCIAHHAVHSGITGSDPALASSCIADPPTAHFVVTLPFPPRIVFDSRAPPALS